MTTSQPAPGTRVWTTSLHDGRGEGIVVEPVRELPKGVVLVDWDNSTLGQGVAHVSRIAWETEPEATDPNQDPAVLDAIGYADRYDPPVAALLRREAEQPERPEPGTRVWGVLGHVNGLVGEVLDPRRQPGVLILGPRDVLVLWDEGTHPVVVSVRAIAWETVAETPPWEIRQVLRVTEAERALLDVALRELADRLVPGSYSLDGVRSLRSRVEALAETPRSRA